MHDIPVADKLISFRCSFFNWSRALPLLHKLLLSLGMAAVTGAAAQIRIQLPFTPVPVTGQTFGVLLAGVILGKRGGGISQLMYVSIGAAGVPWFAGLSGGPAALAGPSGGYMIGFIPAAFFLGHFTDRHARAGNFLPMLGLMLLANFVLIHVPGLLQLGLWLSFTGGGFPSPGPLLLMGTAPFVAGDTIKIIAAALAAGAITPREARGGEIDAHARR